MNKKVEALNELSIAAQINPAFDEQFQIFRYQKLSEEYGDHMNELHLKDNGAVDIASKYAYDQNFRQLKNQIEKSAQMHLDFWNILRDERPDIGKLNECGFNINTSISNVEQIWNALQKISSNVPKTLKLYAKYLIEILNDKEAGQELLSRAKDNSNLKSNLFDGTAMLEDINDISTMSYDGTPCIYVSGDNDKIGIVTQCNASSTRIFGYTNFEMKNHNVERLMPELYAKNHSKILEEALGKGADNIPNKERLVFARHKSGYIFPVWIQLKMFQNMQSGVQFVALFKIDKKLISTNIAYVIINKDKKIAGISSSCIKLLNLDIIKMKRLISANIDINKLMPQLFEHSQSEFSYSQKQGSMVNWYVPDFVKRTQEPVSPLRPDKHKRKGLRDRNDIIKEKERRRTVAVTQQIIQFSCNISNIAMGSVGEIGWYIKLEPINDKKNLLIRRDKEKVKQPLFQFRYDAESGKFVREIKDSIQIDNAAKDYNFLNGKWSSYVTNNNHGYGELSDNSESDIKQQTQEQKEDLDTDVNETKDMEKVKLLTTNLLEQKKQWAQGIQIYTLQKGVFRPKNYDEDQKKEMEMEEARKRKLKEEEDSLQNLDSVKNNIKSRKALHLAINEKSVPSAIKNLRWTMNFVILGLLAIAITEFQIMKNQFDDINTNFNLIQQSYRRISEIQRVVYDVRTLILINEKKLTNYTSYSSQSNFALFLQQDIDDALNSLYSLQNNISLISLKMTDEINNLTDSKIVDLYFKEQMGNMKTLQFTITESVLQISSAIFTARHLNLNQYLETQEDVFFITYNSFNNFYDILERISKLYVRALETRTQEKDNLLLILFLISLGTNLLAIIILFPVVNSVNKTKTKVLNLFVEIPNYHILALSNKCEVFLNNFHEEIPEEVESTDGTTNLKETDSSTQKRNVHKNPKNSQNSSKIFFIQFGTMVIIIMGYFIAMYIISKFHIKNVHVISNEMYVAAEAESYFTFAQNVQREMIYNPNKPILNNSSFNVSKNAIYHLYDLNMKLFNYHFENRKILNSDYLDQYQQTFFNNLCQNKAIKTNLLPFDCNTFISDASTRGLEAVLIRYYEGLRESLSNYVQYQKLKKNVTDLYNSNLFQELYIIQFRFIQDSFRMIVDLLKVSVNDSFSSMVSTKVVAFVIFIIGLILGYLILWIPFVSRLNRDVSTQQLIIVQIWKTKSMLTIIPIEIIAKIPKIQEFLNNQAYFANRQQE